MRIGLTIREITKEIRDIFTRLDNLQAVFGFGSFFKGEKFNDVDVLLVAYENEEDHLCKYYEAKIELDMLADIIGVPIDIVFLTHSEFLEKPLIEMDSLVNIYTKIH